MSFNTTSFFSDITKRRQNEDDTNNDSHNNTTSNIINPETCLSHNLTSDQISPFIPIKSLVESPFKPTNHLSPASRIGSSLPPASPSPSSLSSSPNAKSILKMKVRAHQRQFQDSMNSMQSKFNLDSKQLNPETYLNSAFNSKRSNNGRNTNLMTHLKNIGDNDDDDDDRRMKRISQLGKRSTSSTSTSVIQDLDNPYFAEALGRIVNKELEIRKLMYGILIFLIYRFFRSIIRLFVYTNPSVGEFSNKLARNIDTFGDSISNSNDNLSKFIKWISEFFTFENILKTGAYVEYFMSFILGLIIITSSYRLLKPQDKCLDLPLSKAQRKILGLTLEEDGSKGSTSGMGDEDEDEFMMKKLLSSSSSSSSSPEGMEKPTRIVMPDVEGLEDVMGSLNGLVINNNSNSRSNNVHNTSSLVHRGYYNSNSKEDKLENIRNRITQGNISSNNSFMNSSNKRDFISPNGKYMFEVNNELRPHDSFGTANSSFY